MADPFDRTRMLLGARAMERLRASRVAVFGIGGVGGYACEALIRSGVGAFDLIDSDRVSVTNLNRQVIATRDSIGRYKVDVMKDRMLSINEDASIRTFRSFFLPECADEFPFEEYSYVVDAVDTVTAKIALAVKAKESGVPIISSMGAGNKLDGGRLQVADLYQTKVCPLARVMRRELKKRGVTQLKAVYSDEPPLCPKTGAGNEGEGRSAPPGSVAFVPSVAGLLIAGEVVRDLAYDEEAEKEF